MDEQLKVRLLQEIAVSFPYSYEQIRYVYDDLQSIDATIKTCEWASTQGLSRPRSLILRKYDSPVSFPHNIDLLNAWPFVPSETKDAANKT